MWEQIGDNTKEKSKTLLSPYLAPHRSVNYAVLDGLMLYTEEKVECILSFSWK